jgi:hypothetical protein
MDHVVPDDEAVADCGRLMERMLGCVMVRI